MIKHKAKVIADSKGTDHQYVVYEFGADEGFDLVMDLMATAGSAISSLALATGLNDSGPLGAAFTSFAVQLRQQGGAKLLKRILKDTTRDGRKLDPAGKGEDEATWTFNAAYRANYGEMVRAVAFALEVNFASFFAGSTADLTGLMRMMTQGDQPSES